MQETAGTAHGADEAPSAFALASPGWAMATGSLLESYLLPEYLLPDGLHVMTWVVGAIGFAFYYAAGQQRRGEISMVRLAESLALFIVLVVASWYALLSAMFFSAPDDPVNQGRVLGTLAGSIGALAIYVPAYALFLLWARRSHRSGPGPAIPILAWWRREQPRNEEQSG